MTSQRTSSKENRTMLVSTLFRQFGSCFELFDIAVCQKFAVLSVSKARTNKLYIFRQFTYIFYL